MLTCLIKVLCSVTAIADKLGVEFALIHRKRAGKSESAPEKMDLLVGDVRDKAKQGSVTGSVLLLLTTSQTGCNSGG